MIHCSIISETVRCICAGYSQVLCQLYKVNVADIRYTVVTALRPLYPLQTSLLVCDPIK